jgi:hypothetical protein
VRVAVREEASELQRHCEGGGGRAGPTLRRGEAWRRLGEVDRGGEKGGSEEAASNGGRKSPLRR